MPVIFNDNRMKVKSALNDAITAFLYEAGGELEAQAKRNTRVATGQTKGSFRAVVNQEAGECVVGNTMQNAIWEEFGTGEFAEGGNGRKTAWTYRDAKGKFHRTKGKKPTRALQKAYTKLKPKLIKRARQVIGEGLK
jgi:hypothetical protein